jgi:nucleoside-diphosphate kinase
MAKERTLSIIKPDATERNLTGKINACFEGKGLRIIAQKRLQLSRRLAKEFYIVHKDRPFYDELVEYMVSGPVVIQVLEGENAVAKNREIMGATDPAKAAAGTIRKDFGESIERNSVHGSDSLENAAKEIHFFFSDMEIAS